MQLMILTALALLSLLSVEGRARYEDPAVPYKYYGNRQSRASYEGYGDSIGELGRGPRRIGGYGGYRSGYSGDYGGSGRYGRTGIYERQRGGYGGYDAYESSSRYDRYRDYEYGRYKRPYNRREGRVPYDDYEPSYGRSGGYSSGIGVRFEGGGSRN